MREIVRSDINEEWAHSGIVEAGDFAFINYCVGNIGQLIENQINGAFDFLKCCQGISKRYSHFIISLNQNFL